MACLGQEHKPLGEGGLQQILPVVPELSLGREEQAEVKPAKEPTVHTDGGDYNSLPGFAIAQTG